MLSMMVNFSCKGGEGSLNNKLKTSQKVANNSEQVI